MSLTSIAGNLVLARGQGFLKNLFQSSSARVTAPPYIAGTRGPGARDRVYWSHDPARREARRGATTTKSYPLNVEGGEDQGHYIIFFARVITSPGKLSLGHVAHVRADRATVAELSAEHTSAGLAGMTAAEEVEHFDKLSGARVRLEKEGRRLIAGRAHQSESQSITLASNPNYETPTAISLYMPPSVQVSYESKYGDQEVGVVAETGYNVIKAFMGGGGWTEAMKDITEGGEVAIRQGILATLDTIAPGAKALFAIERGKIITPRMELMFEGIGRRNFSFTFVFIPKSPEEAQEIEDIVKLFKLHMAADYEDSNYREMSFPDLFDIEYMHRHHAIRNPHLNRIATCALTKMDVEYGGDRYVAYDNGRPQSTKLTLNFTEMEIITKTKIEQGY